MIKAAAFCLLSEASLAVALFNAVALLTSAVFAISTRGSQDD